jgi:mannose-6-phosphate isomerase-like protein (cupin superfamily)
MKSWLLLISLAIAAKEPLAQRIAHSDPAKYRRLRGVHAGAGELHFAGLFDASTFSTNFIFLHRGVIQPGGGIGHHYHNHMEEMFVILDGEAEFTIDGRTSLIKGPAGAPCRMGRSHAIYNPGSKPVEWMNIAVGSIKGKYDASDLGDDRVGVSKDPKPVFIHMRLDRALLRPAAGGVLYRRALTPEVFFTNWSYVDHIVVPPGASIAAHRHEGVEEFYYVMAGAGKATVGTEEAPIVKGDAVPVFLNEVHAFANAGPEPLELMVVGVARQKWALDTVEVTGKAAR